MISVLDARHGVSYVDTEVDRTETEVLFVRVGSVRAGTRAQEQLVIFVTLGKGIVREVILSRESVITG